MIPVHTSVVYMPEYNVKSIPTYILWERFKRYSLNFSFSRTHARPYCLYIVSEIVYIFTSSNIGSDTNNVMIELIFPQISMHKYRYQQIWNPTFGLRL